MTLTRRPVETIDLSEDASPEERQYARNRAAGMSKERARRLAQDPRLAGIGVAARVAYQWEAGQARTFEAWLDSKHFRWWHDNQPQRSKSGLPDYRIWGLGWACWVEIKARNPITNRPGKLSPEQRVMHEEFRRAGDEVFVWVFPDDWDSMTVALGTRAA